jgi:predicted lipoprotein with Yx(FWY)xxD motif
MTRQRSLIGLAALLGLVATQACSSDASPDTSSSAGTGGQTSAAGTTSSAGTTSTAQGGGGANATGGTGGGSSSAGATASGGSGGSATGGSGGATAGGASGSGGTAGAAADTFTIQTAGANMVVATANGLTLYFYQPDTPAAGGTAAKSTCSGTCLTHWPLYYGNPVTVPAGLTASDFGSFDRGGGVMQSTYHGWPVYTYDDDKAPGDAKGDLEKANNKVVWYAIKIPYTSPPKP